LLPTHEPYYREKVHHDKETVVGTKMNCGDCCEYAEGRRESAWVALVAQPGEFKAVHDLTEEDLGNITIKCARWSKWEEMDRQIN
jgi:hypothetical protein